jgi:hypothetical protein
MTTSAVERPRTRSGAGRGLRRARWSPHLLLAPLSISAGLAAAALGARLRFVDADGVSYLDVADAFLHGGWAAGVNGYWSPLYPWLLAGGLRLSGAGPAGELVVVQTVSLFAFLLALLAFIAFWRELQPVPKGDEPGITRPGPRIDPWIWWGIGYTLFLWSALRLIRVWAMTPDMLVMAAVLAAAACLLRMRDRSSGWRAAAALGAVLGLGFLAKAVMFPLGILFLLSIAGAVRPIGSALPRMAIAAATFALLAMPFVATLSVQKGRFTFGDSGRLNYARYVNGVPDIHWQGEIPGSGTPRHPTRQLASEPAVFEFAGPVGGTYPVWYDPSYWYDGVQTRLDAGQQLAALVRTGRVYLDLLVRQSAAVAVVVLLLVAAGGSAGSRLRRLGRYWFLWIPAAGAFGMYGLVYVESRYVAPFLILLWGSLLASLDLPGDRLHRRLLNGAAILTIAVLALNLAMPSERSLRRHLAPAQATSGGVWYDVGISGPAAQLPAARGLSELGLRPGDPVAFVGYSYYSYWARLAGLRIVAEIPSSETHWFWQADPEARRGIVSTLFSAGPRAIVVEADSRFPPPEGWHRLQNTAYYVLLAESE